jgi:hypothetical protein
MVRHSVSLGKGGSPRRVVDVMNNNGHCNDGGKRFLGSRERRNFRPSYNSECTFGERFGLRLLLERFS